LEGHRDCVYAFAFSRDGKRVVSASSDRLVKIWDVETGAEVSGFVGVRCGEEMRVFSGFSLFPDGFALEEWSEGRAV